MKLRNPTLIKLAGFLGSLTVKGWMSTLDYRLDTRLSGSHPADPKQNRFIYSFWHESLLFPTLFRTRVNILISQHADGELISEVCRHFRINTIRGSSTRGGSGALLDLIQISKKEHLAITPDGPRGPRRRVQPGVIFLASKTGLPILPFGVGYSGCWRAKSWDQFAIPYPYSSARCVGGEPVMVPANLDLKGLDYYRRLVEGRMLRATMDAERWASGQPRLDPELVVPLGLTA